METTPSLFTVPDYGFIIVWDTKACLRFTDNILWMYRKPENSEPTEVTILINDKELKKLTDLEERHRDHNHGLRFPPLEFSLPAGMRFDIVIRISGKFNFDIKFELGIDLGVPCGSVCGDYYFYDGMVISPDGHGFFTSHGGKIKFNNYPVIPVPAELDISRLTPITDMEKRNAFISFFREGGTSDSYPSSRVAKWLVDLQGDLAMSENLLQAAQDKTLVGY